ncbi:transposase, partial [Rubritalea marina]|uniref:transposase n=1 Tax=Rubritalea marina TaxID=361055 RepID=UPI0003770164
MSSPRTLAPWVGKELRPAIYHCVSRVVDRQFLFGDREKSKFVEIMRLYEEFCGVRVLSFCIMSNHFHILVEVPPRPPEELSDAELVQRVRLVTPKQQADVIENTLQVLSSDRATEKGRIAHKELRERFLSRMWDLSKFMKPLKQRFSRWYNSRNARKGTLWEERFDSTLVEGTTCAITMAGYIELNPIRANMVKRPEDYHWCSYAEAVAGCEKSRLGIARLIEYCEAQSSAQPVLESIQVNDKYAWRSIANRFRMFLYEEGRDLYQEESSSGPVGKQKRCGFSDAEIAAVLNNGGELTLRESLTQRVRFFSKAAVIGSQSFVEDVIEQLQENHYWPAAKEGKKARQHKPQNTNFSINNEPLNTLRSR